MRDPEENKEAQGEYPFPSPFSRRPEPGPPVSDWFQSWSSPPMKSPESETSIPASSQNPPYPQTSRLSGPGSDWSQRNIEGAVARFQQAEQASKAASSLEEYRTSRRVADAAIRDLQKSIAPPLIAVPLLVLEKTEGGVKKGVNVLSNWILNILLTNLALLVIAPLTVAYLYQHFSPYSYDCGWGGNVTIKSSAVLFPLLEAVRKDYQGRCYGTSIRVEAETAGSADIETSDTFLVSKPKNLVDHQVIMILALVVNTNVADVSCLTTKQINDIYSGSVTSWDQLGGPPGKDVVRVGYATDAGIEAAFQQDVLGGTETVIGPASLMTDDVKTVADYIQQHDGAIGYVPLSFAKTYHLKILRIDGQAPTPDTVKTGKYRFWNVEHLYTQGDPTSLTKNFIDYFFTRNATTLIEENGFVNINDLAPQALSNHSSDLQEC
jgi:phosphate transport system substrate-binding protein